MAFSLDRKYSFFKACIGKPEDNYCSNGKEKIKFQVLGNGVPYKLNGKSWMTKANDEKATCLIVGVGNVSMLELRTQHESYSHPCKYSAWANAALFLKGMLSYRKSNFIA